MIDIPVQERPRRVFAEVVEIANGRYGRIIKLNIPRWREDEKVILPEHEFPETVRTVLVKGVWLTVDLNAEAERVEDLRFEDFRLVADKDEGETP